MRHFRAKSQHVNTLPKDKAKTSQNSRIQGRVRERDPLRVLPHDKLLFLDRPEARSRASGKV